MTTEIKVMIYGIGAIGSRIAKLALKKKGIVVVGAVDLAEEKVGKDLGEVLGVGKVGVTITDEAEELFSRIEADIVLHATRSYLREVYDQIMLCVESGFNLISTCEELAYPWIKHPQLASEIDGAAKISGVTVLGTGINPGYLMDTLPILLTGMCGEVKSIEVVRAIPVLRRRLPFQKKVGVGMKSEEFMEKLKSGEITGHVGFTESIAMIAAALGWKLDEIRELPPEPIIAEREIETPHFKIKPGEMLGHVAGAQGFMNGKPVITLKFIAHAGVEEGYNEYVIEGEPTIKVKTSEVLGDWETAHVVINMIPRVLNARPGLLTMKDLPLPSAMLGDARLFLEW